MSFTTFAQIQALTDIELAAAAAFKLGWITHPSNPAWDAQHTFGAIWRDRYQYFWIYDIDGVRDLRRLYCNAGPYAGEAYSIATLASAAINDSNPPSSGTGWRQNLEYSVAAWSSITP